MSPPPGSVTALLRGWSRGDPSVVDELTPLVYSELRRLADGFMRREAQSHTLQPTALIHEAYMRLIQQGQPEWEGRSHFFRFAAHLMRQILVDHARTRRAQKRGGNAERVPLDQVEASLGQGGIDVVALDEALSQLAQFDERKARMVELKYFGGMTEKEVAEAMGTSERTLRRELQLAKAWLSQALG